MKKMLFALVLLYTHAGICQEKKEKKRTYDDPKLSRNLSLFADFGYNMSVNGLPVRATLFFTGQYIDFQAEQSLTTIGKLNSDTMRKYGIKPFNSSEIGLNFHFSRKQKTVSKKLVLSSWVSGEMRYERSTRIHLETLRLYSVRGGLDVFNSNIAMATIQNQSQYVNYKSAILYAGLSSKRIFNAKLDDPRKVGIKYNRELYLDMLIPSSTSIGQTTLPLSPGNDVTHAVKRPLGWRFGWAIHSTKIFGLYFRWDAGVMPGYQEVAADNSSKSIFTSMYTSFNLGLGFSCGVLKHTPI